jgi:hypothetical protein
MWACRVVRSIYESAPMGELTVAFRARDGEGTFKAPAGIAADHVARLSHLGQTVRDSNRHDQAGNLLVILGHNFAPFLRHSNLSVRNDKIGACQSSGSSNSD